MSGIPPRAAVPYVRAEVEPQAGKSVTLVNPNVNSGATCRQRTTETMNDLQKTLAEDRDEEESFVLI